MEKLFLVTRKDLSPGARASQLVHGVVEFCRLHPEGSDDWYTRSNTVVLLEVENESALSVLRDEALAQQVQMAEFREPDLDDALTCVVLGPESRPLTQHLSLAFR